MTTLTTDQVMVTAFHALANAARFLEDAAVLYQSQRRSGSYLSTVAAREEHGRFNLLCFAAKEIEDGMALTAKELRSRIQPAQKPHQAKLQAGQSTYFLEGPLPKATFIERQALYAEMRTIDSRATHERRLQEQYVDLKIDGSCSTPGRISLHDVLNFIWVVGGEVGDTLMSIEGDERFATAVANSLVSLPRSLDVQSRIFALSQFEHAET